MLFPGLFQQLGSSFVPRVFLWKRDPGHKAAIHEIIAFVMKEGYYGIFKVAVSQSINTEWG